MLQLPDHHQATKPSSASQSQNPARGIHLWPPWPAAKAAKANARQASAFQTQGSIPAFYHAPRSLPTANPPSPAWGQFTLPQSKLSPLGAPKFPIVAPLAR